MTKEKLNELRALNLPSAKLSEVIKETSDPDKAMPVLVEEAQPYFDHFLAVRKDCVSCGLALTGWLGSFVWGLAHGEGYCSSCSYPCRALHVIQTPTTGTITLRNLVLQYHPNDIVLKETNLE